MRAILLGIALSLCSLAIGARVVIYGDTRGENSVHAAIVEQISTHHPDAVFHTGDLSQRGTQQQDYDLFLSTIAPLGNLQSYYPVRGNHDRDRDLLLRNFPHLNGSTWYSVEIDSIRFIVLDSVESLKPGSSQYIWLESQLQASTEVPAIVLVHHPLFSSGAHGSTPGLALYLTPLFQRYRVRAVFSGHEHSYERSVYNGIHYIVTGGGGSPLRETSHPNPYSQVFYLGYHYIICDREAGNLRITAIALDGSIIEKADVPLR